MLMQQTLDYVFLNAEKSNPKSILQTIDNFVLESGQFLMNVGPEKGEILREYLVKSKPNNVIELGTFIGYSAVLISSTIEEKSKLTSGAKELVKHIGISLLHLHKMVARVEVTEKPELLWDYPELERFYARLEDEFELQERHKAVERKIELISRTAETVLDLLQTQRGLRVEWYIVILIVVEIMFTIYDMFIRNIH